MVTPICCCCCYSAKEGSIVLSCEYTTDFDSLASVGSPIVDLNLESDLSYNYVYGFYEHDYDGHPVFYPFDYSKFVPYLNLFFKPPLGWDYFGYEPDSFDPWSYPSSAYTSLKFNFSCSFVISVYVRRPVLELIIRYPDLANSSDYSYNVVNYDYELHDFPININLSKTLPADICISDFNYGYKPDYRPENHYFQVLKDRMSFDSVFGEEIRQLYPSLLSGFYDLIKSNPGYSLEYEYKIIESYGNPYTEQVKSLVSCDGSHVSGSSVHSFSSKYSVEFISDKG
ncbi:hypothetical protein IO424_001767 [Campylobacter fetus]|uniref:hypothetical protein n=1 Tax=Campylobacter fetus TaxID=196 RepID=UPI0005090FBC|nr:hypothetical protein [Campylobacter fetus]WKW17953.1 hypothetical protein IXZ25_03495 [Campylobacter fetus subsp. fetus]AIR78582.1 hypothetical protein CFF04554_0665 [Campylobacter fetus subsp. fetus 04/554]EAJ5693204.1 hypothetical protein [Campylobacter fetus]EAJ5705146.1 hypothetical protein [Campylobacter fetus]EAJ9257416.1 hypothetical protein [Campylobacter fetus]